MTKAQALTLLADLVGDDPTYAPALEALAPKPRAVKASPVEWAAKTILRELRRPDGFGTFTASDELRAYAEAMGRPWDPQAPTAEAFGKPAPVAWVARAAHDWQDDEKRRAADRANADAWRYSPDGQAFEAARARHEARAAQFAYTPKGKKDDERATFALAVLARQGGDGVRRSTVLAAMIVAALFLAVGITTRGESHARPAISCAEDDPCWDCATMGNRICGPGATRPNGEAVRP